MMAGSMVREDIGGEKTEVEEGKLVRERNRKRNVEMKGEKSETKERFIYKVKSENLVQMFI